MYARSSRAGQGRESREKEDVNGALQNLQAREPDAAITPARSYTFPRPHHPHGIALRPGPLLPCPLLWWSFFFFLFPMAAAAWCWWCMRISMRRLVSTCMQFRAASSWRSSRCLAPVLRARPLLQNPSDAWICVFCVFLIGLECWKAPLVCMHAIARGRWHEAKTDTKSISSCSIASARGKRSAFTIYLPRAHAIYIHVLGVTENGSSLWTRWNARWTKIRGPELAVDCCIINYNAIFYGR